jgi:hypothetical protein
MRFANPAKGDSVDSKLKRRLAVGGVALTAFGAGGAAYAVTNNGNSDRDAYLNDLANRLHVSRDQLNSALQGAFDDRLDAAVKAGKLTQEQANAIKQKVENGGGVPFFGGPGPGPGLGFGHEFFAIGPDLFGQGFDAAAKYLGLTSAQLKQQLGSGKSLAQIAGDKQKSVSGLEQAIKDSVKSNLDTLVSSKKITQQQENRILGNLDKRIGNLVNRTLPRFGTARKGLFRGPKGWHVRGAGAPAPPAPAPGPLI